MQHDTRNSSTVGVRAWLWLVFSMIAAMVVVGGVTRLTGSGLSMTEWRPLMGTLPPLDDAAWQAVFAQYQTSPQFLQVNHWMTLADFKQIFFWEYLHRLLGRLIGVVFFLPWVWFLIRRKLDRRLAIRTAIAFLLGGAQGLLGWFMVKSGLVDRPEVSHYRLAAHLSLAFFVGAYVFWLLLDLRARPREASGRLRRWAVGFVALLSVQIVYGAFMAGSRAGYLYQTFPTMNGEWVPGNMDWSALTSDHVAIHFIHRSLGWIVAAMAIGLAWAARRTSAGRWLAAAVLVQFGLGVLTVLYGIPVALGAAHQLGALILLCVALWLVHHTSPSRALR